MAASKGSVTVTKKKKHSISTPTLILVPASNRVETQARFLGWLVSHFEKRNICLYVSILMLSILRPFQPFRNALFDHSSVVFFLFKGLSSSLWFPFHLKKSINNPDENRLDIPELWNQQILFKPCWWRSRRSQGGWGQRARTWWMRSPPSPCQPSCPRELWFLGWFNNSRSLGM